MPKKGKLTEETVYYKFGGTYYKVSTSCGGSELLYDKIGRLKKTDAVVLPANEEKKARYNTDNAPMEGFWGVLKRGGHYGRRFTGGENSFR